MKRNLLKEIKNIIMSKKMDELSELYYVYSHNAF